MQSHSQQHKVIAIVIDYFCCVIAPCLVEAEVIDNTLVTVKKETEDTEKEGTAPPRKKLRGERQLLHLIGDVCNKPSTQWRSQGWARAGTCPSNFSTCLIIVCLKIDIL